MGKKGWCNSKLPSSETHSPPDLSSSTVPQQALFKPCLYLLLICTSMISLIQGSCSLLLWGQDNSDPRGAGT